MKGIGVWEDIYNEFLMYGVKESTARVYTISLKVLCRFAKVSDAYALIELGLDKIERVTLEFIRANEGVRAPKYLNIVYCAVKRWCTINELIKNAKMFKEIRFDKSSRKMEALTETALETQHVKNGFKVCDLEDRIDWGLYGLVGLRPAIIPQLRVKHIFSRNRKVENGKISLVKPTIMIIPREIKGNKANITFMVFIPTKLSDLIELRLNHNHKEVTLETRISTSDNDRDMYYKIKRIYKKIGFNGRPYLLRSYADGLVERITRIHNDEDFKEFLMGHKGKISAVYQMKGLTTESEELYREMYVSAVDNWINEHIFEMRLKEECYKAEMLIRGALTTGVELNMEEVGKLKELFNSGKLSFEHFNDQLRRMAHQALQKHMRSEFENLYLEMQAKHNNHVSASSA